MRQCLFTQRSTVQTVFIHRSWGDLWPVHAHLDHKRPGRFSEWVWCWRMIQDSREQMEPFLPHEASAQLGSPPRIKHLSAAASVAVETELLWSQFPTNSCSKAKQIIDPVFFTLLYLEYGDDLWYVCVMFVVWWVITANACASIRLYMCTCNGFDRPVGEDMMYNRLLIGHKLHKSSKGSKEL